MSVFRITPNGSRLFLLCMVSMLGACTTLSPVTTQPRMAYVANAPKVDPAFGQFAPVFVHENDAQLHNRIGHAVARKDHNGDIRIAIDPAAPKFYVQQTRFEGERGKYKNLIYRIHFQRVPHSLIPFHLTAGKNGGILFIVTVNVENQPVLYTTVHTCGCYLAFIPTSYLPKAAFPEKWPEHEQNVYAEQLPAHLSFNTQDRQELYPVIRLKDGTHRVKDIELLSMGEITNLYRTITTPLESMTALKRIPIEDKTISFYNTKGFKQGYVRNTVKPWELLLMSWWVLDLNVGIDKEYGDSEQTGTVFYTSLKPWNRRASDMWHFAEFLKFWGWRL